MRSPATAAILGLGCLLLTGGCQSEPRPPSRPTLATTVPPEGFVLRELVGDAAEVLVLVGPGDNPHTWQPTDATTSKLARAAVFFRVGIPIERGPWFEAIAAAGPGVVDFEPPVADPHADPHADHVGGPHADPHPWNDPRALARHAEIALPVLRTVLPDQASELDRRAAALQGTLEALDRELAATLAPCRGRPFLVHHPAWDALAARYGLVQIAVEVEGKDPLDHELAELRDRVAREGLTTLFVQPQVRRGPALAVASTLGLETVEVDPLAADPPTALRYAAAAIAKTCGAAPTPEPVL